MKILWFKQEFVGSILSGEKRDTIRKASRRLPQAGDIVQFSVGPRPAFARARITAVTPVRHASISAARRAQLARCYEAADPADDMVRLTFDLLSQ
jgi:hypothetical protein